MIVKNLKNTDRELGQFIVSNITVNESVLDKRLISADQLLN